MTKELGYGQISIHNEYPMMEGVVHGRVGRSRSRSGFWHTIRSKSEFGLGLDLGLPRSRFGLCLNFGLS